MEGPCHTLVQRFTSREHIPKNNLFFLFLFLIFNIATLKFIYMMTTSEGVISPAKTSDLSIL